MSQVFQLFGWAMSCGDSVCVIIVNEIGCDDCYQHLLTKAHKHLFYHMQYTTLSISSFLIKFLDHLNYQHN